MSPNATLDAAAVTQRIDGPVDSSDVSLDRYVTRSRLDALETQFSASLLAALYIGQGLHTPNY